MNNYWPSIGKCSATQLHYLLSMLSAMTGFLPGRGKASFLFVSVREAMSCQDPSNTDCEQQGVGPS